MKEYDKVRVIKDRERYIKAGVYKGMVGVIMDPRCINGQWLVIFSESGTGDDIADIPIREEDLEVISDEEFGRVVLIQSELSAKNDK